MQAGLELVVMVRCLMRVLVQMQFVPVVLFVRVRLACWRSLGVCSYTRLACWTPHLACVYVLACECIRKVRKAYLNVVLVVAL